MFDAILKVIKRGDMPAPAHLRQSDDNAQTEARRPEQREDITYMAHRAWVHRTEQTEGGATVDVHELKATANTNGLSGDIDGVDKAVMARMKLKPDVYAAMKPLWADGIGYRDAGTTDVVRNLTKAGERTRAKYWRAYNVAQAQRAPSPGTR